MKQAFIPIIYIYKESPAAWQELKYSLRSLRNLKFKHKVYIVSDTLPDWIKNITWIQSEPNNSSRYLDVSNKIFQIANQFPTGVNVIFMYDDQYFIKPLYAPEKLDITKYYLTLGPRPMPTTNNWHKLLTRSLEHLIKAFHPSYNYETHLPRYVNLDDVFNAYKEFPILKYNLQRWTIIANHALFNRFDSLELLNFKPELLNVKSIKAGFYGYSSEFSFSSASDKEILSAVENKWILNHNDDGLTDALKNYLIKNFPEKSEYEL